jgi:hypothetical protein
MIAQYQFNCYMRTVTAMADWRGTVCRDAGIDGAVADRKESTRLQAVPRLSCHYCMPISNI